MVGSDSSYYNIVIWINPLVENKNIMYKKKAHHLKNQEIAANIMENFMATFWGQD